MNCRGFGFAVLNGYICAKKFDMRKLLGILFCALVAAVCGCGGNDYSQEVKYLQGVYNSDSVEILKAKSIRAYNPLQDDDEGRVVVWSYTHAHMLRKAQGADEFYQTLLSAFQSPNANSDAMVVECMVGGQKLSTIIFSINGGYYQSYQSIKETIFNAASSENDDVENANRQFKETLQKRLERERQ